MLTTLLGRHADVYAFPGESDFFEHYASLRAMDDAVPHIVRSAIGDAAPVPEALHEELVGALRRHHEKGASIPALYDQGKNIIAASDGARRWAQKATSYIYYVDDILEAFPSARLVFLLRNPVDIAASLKRRGGWNRVLRMIWGWNVGIRIAQRWRDDERVRLVRYEDLVRTPGPELRAVCAFADLTFDDTLLDVPHVNRSETPYNTNSDTRGINDSRVHYYQDVLSPEEEAVVRHWVDREKFRTAYPDFPVPRSHSTAGKIKHTSLAIGGLVQTLASDHGGKLFRDPRHVLDRIRRRL